MACAELPSGKVIVLWFPLANLELSFNYIFKIFKMLIQLRSLGSKQLKLLVGCNEIHEVPMERAFS